MDGTAAIADNTQALKRIVAGLVGMAGLADGPSAAAISRSEPAGAAAGPTTGCRSPAAGPRLTLPRHLRLAILRLLRPAEAAARRLIIASARGLVVLLPPRRRRRPKPVTIEPQLRRFGIAVVLSPADVAAAARLSRSRGRATAGRGAGGGEGRAGGSGPRIPNFPLFDPPRRFRKPGRRAVPAHAAPRILLPGVAEPFCLPPPLSPDDPVDATRLTARLAALAAALDDIEGQARRFARWKAFRDPAVAQDRNRAAAGAQDRNRDAAGGQHTRRDAAGAQETGRDGKPSAPGRARRVWPLRAGRPPGGRLSRYKPGAASRVHIREVDEILAHAHALAVHALQHPDTS